MTLRRSVIALEEAGRMRDVVRGLLLLLMAAVAVPAPAPAEDYPSGPVKIIVPAAAGGSIDVITRLFADQLTHRWQQQVLILNHPGGGTAIGVRAAATSPPDGSTLFLGISSSFVALPVLQ